MVTVWAGPSLYIAIAVAVGPVGLSHVHATHGQTHAVDAVASWGHPLVDSVQTFGLLEAADPMLRGEASDRCKTRTTQTAQLILYPNPTRSKGNIQDTD